MAKRRTRASPRIGCESGETKTNDGARNGGQGDCSQPLCRRPAPPLKGMPGHTESIPAGPVLPYNAATLHLAKGNPMRHALTCLMWSVALPAGLPGYVAAAPPEVSVSRPIEREI